MIEALNYIGFTSPAAKEWETFGPEILGVQLADPGPEGSVRMRVDDAAHRISVHPADSDDLAYLGWGVRGPSALIRVTDRLETSGTEVHRGEPELAAERGVTELAWFTDPFGFRHELSWGQLTMPSTFLPGRPLSGFVTGEQGLGHAVLIIPDLVEAEAFYGGVLGFKVSDEIDMHGMPVRFYHCNTRHHSLALTAVPGVVGFHHLMLETTALDDVGIAYDLILERGIPLAMTLGRHTNDLMTSFYVRTPSRFEIEYGFGGAPIQSTPPTPRAFARTSIWGHHPPAEPLAPGIIRAYVEENR
ncbi:VOC family protein [Microtetraspora sp. AC03309]|uniref:VOC family protein n=1 Tax=Microtetraspora sp. AC03309 TaxID=2779376 RepID=UPI001E3AF6A0|nr:VOC family protein [Microtetraspora sp. AC03309]MCC5575371.1 VOC family protein [Microtetraspora sp. AC03309]